MKTIIINDDRLAHLKGQMVASDMTSNIWGAEFADGAYDYKSSEITFKVAEKYDDGKLRLIDISNDGYPLSIKNLNNRFLRFPTTVFDYTPGNLLVVELERKKHLSKIYYDYWNADNDTLTPILYGLSRGLVNSIVDRGIGSNSRPVIIVETMSDTMYLNAFDKFLQDKIIQMCCTISTYWNTLKIIKDCLFSRI